MKKMLILMAACIVTILTGCSTVYRNNFGFGSIPPGIIYNNQTKGGFILPKFESMSGVEVLGKVRGESSSMNVFLISTFGDCGIESAKKDALKKFPEADDIVNIEVDNKHDHAFFIFDRNTTILTGIAIKYKK